MSNQSGRTWALIAVAIGLLLYGGKKVIDSIARSEGEKKYMPLVDATSARVGLAPNILRAIVAQESNWNPAAVNKASNDHGLTQINIKNAITINKRLGRRDTLPDALYDPAINLLYAEYLLREIKAQGYRDAVDFFDAWNVGWPADVIGTPNSKHLAKYVSHFNDYQKRESGLA